MNATAAVALAVALALGPTPALAQQACAPLQKGLTTLAKHFGEIIVWSGRVGNRELYLTQSPLRHTWTLIAVKFTLAGAEGCILQAGTAGSLVGDPMNGSISFTVAGPATAIIGGGM